LSKLYGPAPSAKDILGLIEPRDAAGSAESKSVAEVETERAHGAGEWSASPIERIARHEEDLLHESRAGDSQSPTALDPANSKLWSLFASPVKPDQRHGESLLKLFQGGAPARTTDQTAADKPSEPASPANAGKYPIQSWTMLRDAPAAALLPQGGELAPATRPVVPAAKSLRPASPRQAAAGGLSTATVPLPEPAADMSTAQAATRPGVLTTAVYEIASPPPEEAEPSLATHTLPLPEWIAPPYSPVPEWRRR
jgi:hypothetical protein